MIQVRVSPEPFDAGVEIVALGLEGVGAIASFVGVVRGDGGLVALTLEHYPSMTQAALTAIAREALARWSLSAVCIHHRTGDLRVGDPVVFVGTAAPHRHDALDGCAFVIDRLKTDAPFWKRETFSDGRSTWVEGRASDDAAAARWDQKGA